MSNATANPTDTARRIEELGRIILAYSEVTEKLQQSHNQLTQTVQLLRQELSLLHRSTERCFAEPEDRALAEVGDFQGVGGTPGSAWRVSP